MNAAGIAAEGLNRLYLRLAQDNPAGAGSPQGYDLDWFMARLVFCLLSEGAGPLPGAGASIRGLAAQGAVDGSDLPGILASRFGAMTPDDGQRPGWPAPGPQRQGAGGLSEAGAALPRFSRLSRDHLLHLAGLDWSAVGPEIFGWMIQTTADRHERGALGMHYTSGPNILKVLDPLFLDGLREALAEAGDDPGKLQALRGRLARIVVFDPACGTGNFLIAAYRELRTLEATVNRRLGAVGQPSLLSLANFRGIELHALPATVAGLALTIAEIQCDRQHGIGANPGPGAARQASRILCGNALRLDWTELCPPAEAAASGSQGPGLPGAVPETTATDPGPEIHICGNPPYKGSQSQSAAQKADLEAVFGGSTTGWKALDYAAGWILKAAEHGRQTGSSAAFVCTNSLCQGRQVDRLWPLVRRAGRHISFAHTSFPWAAPDVRSAVVTVVIIGISGDADAPRRLYSADPDGAVRTRRVARINAWLAPGPDVTVRPRPRPICGLGEMVFGNMPNDGGHLLLDPAEAEAAVRLHGVPARFIRRFIGSQEFIRGLRRHCLWIGAEDAAEAMANPWLKPRLDAVRALRAASGRATTRVLASQPHRFGEVRQRGDETLLIVPAVSSEFRDHLPVGLLAAGTIASNSAFVIRDAPLWNLALVASRLHLVWIARVCGRLKTDFRYSSTLGWNTFPVPALDQGHREALIQSATAILSARQDHSPASIAELYTRGRMPGSLSLAHRLNDEVVEGIFAGRGFRDDSERFEHLLARYCDLTG